MPVQMIGFYIGKESIVGAKFLDKCGHKTRYLDDDDGSLLSFFSDLGNCFRKGDIEITREIYRFLARKLFFEYTIEDPRGGRLAICTGHGDDSALLREVLISEV
jgi:hypothetical protein